jgi:hypothetical protein
VFVAALHHSQSHTKCSSFQSLAEALRILLFFCIFGLS